MAADLSVDFSTTEENRDAANAADNSRNDWYSRYATDRSISLRQTVKASYGIELGENKYFDTGFGIGVYEDNTAHFSRAYGMEESSNALWQVNAGPDLSISFRNSSWHYTLYTRGRSMAVPQGDAVSTLLDVSNPTDITTGNIYLKPGYHQDINLAMNYGRRNRSRSYALIRLTGSMDMNEITRASWYDDSAVRYSIPVNDRRPRYNANLKKQITDISGQLLSLCNAKK